MARHAPFTPRFLWLAALGIALLSCAGNQLIQHQRKGVSALTPVPVMAPRAPVATAPRPLRIRVYADREHRSESSDWERKLRRIIVRANDVLTPAYGVELIIVSTHDWERESASSDVGDMISELEARDAGEGADWIIGLVTQLPRESSNLHDLGAARYVSKHLILRGSNDLAEFNTYRKRFDRLDEEVVNVLYDARVGHKQLLTLLHELGHTLGAFHTDVASIMRPNYAPKISWFAPHNDAIVALGLKFRGNDPVEVGEYKPRLIETLRRLDRDGVDVRVPLQSLGIHFGDATPASKATAAAVSEGIEQALALARSGKDDEARERLTTLSTEEAQSLAVVHLRCRLEHGAEAGKGNACTAAREAGFGGAQESWELAKAYRLRSMPEQERFAMHAARLALRAETLLNKQLRLHLARRSLVLAHFSELEDFLAPLESDEMIAKLKNGATRERRLFGIHPAAVSEEDEAEAYALVKQALSQVQKRDFGAAKRLVATGRKRFPMMAGFVTVLCDLEIRQQKLPKAWTRCNEAIRMDPESTWARYLAGAVAHHRGQDGKSMALLQESVDLGIEMVGAWKLLTTLHKNAGDEAEVAALRKRFLDTFGRQSSF